METPANTDHIIRDKFENFHPEPPPYIWEGVKAGIANQATSGFFATNGRKIAIAAVILLLTSLGLWLALPFGNTPDDIENIAHISDDNDDKNSGGVIDDENKSESGELADYGENAAKDNTEADEQAEQLQANNSIDDQSEAIAAEKKTIQLNDEDIVNSDERTSVVIDAGQSTANTSLTNTPDKEKSLLAINEMNSLDGNLDNETEATLVESETTEAAPQIQMPKEKSKINRWSHSIYFSPEFILNDFDSVRILPTYALNYEPTYHFSKHWFMRFGAGLSYARERGFAKLDYVSNEVVGSYEDVYDVTFDTIGGSVIPTFHTKTTEVWDSVRHIQVKEVTNKYLYLQTPLLFGYNNNSKKFNWFIYGGPALNMVVGKWIEKPEDEIDNADIVNLENNLPNRSPFYMQLWLGAGIEYKVGKQLSLALEPNYRYHFSQVYDDPAFNTALSGFSLRFGIVFTIK